MFVAAAAASERGATISGYAPEEPAEAPTTSDRYPSDTCAPAVHAATAPPREESTRGLRDCAKEPSPSPVCAAASCTKARPTDDEAGSGTVSSARMRGEVRSPNEVGSGRPFALIHDLSAITHTSSRP